MSLKKSVKMAFLHLGGFPLRSVYGGRGQILFLHRLLLDNQGPSSMNANLEVSAGFLKEIIAFYRKRNYEFISMDQIPDFLGSRNGRFVSLTFDDGFADNHSVALPLLSGYGIPFTVYISTSYPDHKAITWNYLLEDLVLSREHVQFPYQGSAHKFPCRALDEKKQTWLMIRDLIKKHSKNEQTRILEEFFRSYEIDPYSRIKKLALSWDQIKELSDHPLVSIGSHMVNHLQANTLSDEELRFEIRESVRMLEENTGKTIKHFAFPYGGRKEVGVRQMEIASEFGFTTIVTTMQNNVFKAHLKYMDRLPRIRLANNDMKRFLLYFYGIEPAFRNKFRRV